jgi:glycosyltransferase involved in cell wall biosynthesis
MNVLLIQKISAIAGSEFYILKLLPELQKNGLNVRMVVMYEPAYEKVIDEFTAKLDESNIPSHRIIAGKFPGPSVIRKISNIISIHDISLVHSNLVFSDLTIGLTKLFSRKSFKIVSVKHGYEATYAAKYGIDPSHKRIDFTYVVFKLAESFVDRTIFITEGLQKLYVGLGITKLERSEIIHFGFDFDDNYKVDDSLKFGHPQLVIVGRLEHVKGHRFAFAALKTLKNKYPNISLVVVGWGSLTENLKEMAQLAGLENNVHFVGRKTNPRDYMASSDVVLMPSVAEGFGIVLLEAASVKKPVVAFDVYSPKELFCHNKEILLAKAFDVEEYTNHIDSLLSNKDFYDEISENFFVKLKNYYSLNRMVNQTIEAYNRALSS